ncbi:hypothetical protein Tco_1132424 [Tanacetum coccineum]|uniref:Retrovirus-related Pol polyprotein from transposon TNT 1-94 n=1 Tax=Tanacetum coccineum TaxID=301880 RepID=A0ABQ5JBZ8_9ASTR
MCHILGIESHFENIIINGPFITMTAGQRKPERQWTGDERKAANLDQRLKSLIMFVHSDDQMNSVINCLTAKSTWDDLILYHEGPSDVKESRLLKKWLCFCQSLRKTNHVKDSELAFLFDSPDDEEDTKSSHEYLNDLEEEYQGGALLAKSKRFFKKGHFARDCWSKASVPSYQSPFQPKPLSSSQHKPELRPTKDFKAKYNKVKAKLALLSSSASASKAITIKNKGGNGRIGGSKFGVGEGKVVSMGGIGGGAFSIHSIVLKDGRGGGGLVVDGGRSSRVSRKA